MTERKNKKYRIHRVRPLVALSLLVLAACTANDDAMRGSATGESQGKTPIELSVGMVGSLSGSTRSAGAPARTTRAVVTTDSPYGQSATAFSEATSLYMVMKCDKETATTSTKYARTIGTVAAGQLPVSFTDSYKRYYEDACPAPSRDAKVSIYAACVPGKANAIGIDGSTDYSQNSFAWSTAAPTTAIVWPLGRTDAKKLEQDQSGDFVADQDLCFSNNIGNLNATDNRIAYNTTTRKFTTDLTNGTNPECGGKMIFYHALTKVTFKLIMGVEFTKDEFTFSVPNQNLQLVGFNSSGTLTLTTGEFTGIGTETINRLAVTDNRDDATLHDYELTGFLVPGSDLNGTDKDATDKINFTISDNAYHVTKAQLANALHNKTLEHNSEPALLTDGNKMLMRRGVHYIFTMTVHKKDVAGITASVADWEDVEADHVPTNARITIDMLTNGTPETGAPANFDLYRLVHVHHEISDVRSDYSWMNANPSNAEESDYTASGNKATLTGAGNPYTTNWYWTNNRTFYHFRTVKPKDHDVIADATDGDYITLRGAQDYTDVCWGAPFYARSTSELGTPLHADKLTYSLTTGFDNETTTTTGEAPNQVTTTTHQISKAIGPTQGIINMEMFHMMSDVTITLTTTDGSDAVTLIDKTDPENPVPATITLSNIYPTAKVRLGNGLVVPDGTPDKVNGTDLVGTDDKWEWKWGFVPQSLSGVQLTITTPDHNHYIIDMNTVVAAGSSIEQKLIANPYTETATGSGKYTIDRWYPNFRYSYTFNLTKKGVEKITATLADWQTVTADETPVQIK